MKTCALILALAGLLRADLTPILAEPNLEKRAEALLAHADKLLKSSRKAYDEGDQEALAAQVAEAKQAVTLSLESLEGTGKDPRRKSKYFKRAEIRTRVLIREVTRFSEAMNYADRPVLEPLEKELRRVNDELVRGIMGVRRKE